MAATSGTVAANDGVPLAYERWTPSSPKHTLVLVHGWSGSRRYFDGVVPGFVAAGYDVLAIDLRFHGASGPERRPVTNTTPPSAHVARLTVDVDNVLAALHVDKAIVVGTSMGASILWCYGELFGRGRIERIVVVDQAPLQNRASDWSLGSTGCFDAASLAGLQAAVRGDVGAFADGNAAACLALPIDDATRDLLASETARADRDALAALMADHTQLDWRPAVRVCPHDMLVVVGGASQIFPPAGCAWVAAHAPRAECVTFEGCGHWLYVEKAAVFVNCVVEWVEKGGSGGREEGGLSSGA